MAKPPTPIRHDQIISAFEQVRVAAPMSIIAALIVAYTLYEVTPFSTLFTVTAVLICVCLVRLLSGLVFLRLGPDASQSRFWENVFLGGVVLQGIAWALLIFLTFPMEYPEKAMLMSLIMVGLSAIGVATLAFDLRATQCFLLLYLTPALIMLALSPVPVLNRTAPLGVIFLLMMWIAAKQINRNYQRYLEADHSVSQQAFELEISQQRRRAILDNAADAIFLLDRDGNLKEVNKKACQSLGYSAEELLTMKVADIEVKEDLRLPMDHWDERQTEYVTLQGEHRRRDGSTFPVEINGYTYREGEDELMVALARDVTQRRKEADELRAAKESAEIANVSKSQFLANMSHEIRTPMNGVSGLAQLLQRTELDERQRNYVETILLSCDSLLTVINDILDFSKIEADRVVLVESSFDMRVLISEMTALLGAEARRKKLDMIIDFSLTAPCLYQGDQGRLRQVLMNLLGNALKFTSKGHVLLRVAVSDVRAQSAALHFTIQDTGIGIEAAALDTLFDPFTQVENSATRNFEGTGLGLAISKKLIGLMGGELNVESRPGEGSSFHFSVVLGCEEPNRIPASRSLADKRVLLTGVESMRRDNTAGQLGAIGCHVDCVDIPELLAGDDGADFEAYDLLVIVESFAANGNIAEVLAGPVAKKFPEILIVSRDSPGNTDEMDGALFVHRLTNPIHEHELFQVVSTLLGAEAPTMARPPGDKNADSHPDGIAPHYRVLLVEDNLTNQYVAKAMLEKLNCTVGLALDGREALSMVEQEAFDLIFMDCMMPNMDGYEATRRLRQKQRQEDSYTPIVALTANAMRTDQDKCIASGMDEVIVKPIKIADLERALVSFARTA